MHCNIENILVWAALMIACLNCLSFVLVRIYNTVNGRTAAALIVRGAMDDWAVGRTTYLVAGNLNQAETAFRFLEPELSGRIVYARFREMGWSAEWAANMIERDIRLSQTDKARIYTISLGDHVTSYLEERMTWLDLEVIAINPCTDVTFMRKPLGTVLKVGAPVFEVICHALGWLSAIPIIPMAGGNYSLVLLADQYWSIAYDRHEKAATEETIGVILSEPEGDRSGGLIGKIFGWSPDDETDGLLDNAVAREYFRNAGKIVTIKTGHSAMVGENAEKYLEGVREILRGHSESEVSS